MYEFAQRHFGGEDLLGAITTLEYIYDRKMALPDGCVYVLKSGNYYKIGRSRQPDKRIKTLKIQLPFPVEVFALIPCERCIDSEMALHELFGDKRVNGEWFHLSPNEVAWVKDVVWSPRALRGGSAPPFYEGMPPVMEFREKWERYRELVLR